jgi:hypothetical protein
MLFQPTVNASVRARRTLSTMLVATGLIATGFLATAPTALAQDESASGGGQRDLTGVSKSLSDFVHYVLIGKADLAQAAAEAVLSASATDADLASVVDEQGLGERLDRAISRSRLMGEVSDLATRIEDRVEDGRKLLARSPARIGEAIEMLNKTLRERMIAEERITAAGEYAAPQLLKVLVESRDPAKELEAAKAIRLLESKAVLPLAMSLVDLDASGQRKVVALLGELGRPLAIPFILELGAREGTSDELRAACEAAVTQLGGQARDVSAQFTALARRFFDREDTLIPNPTDSVNNIWSYDASGFGGLNASPVATSVFCDEMAKLLSRRALAADASNTAALAIFVAADLRRENTLGGDAEAQRYSPQFFATASGPSVCSEVLGMAIDSRDTALIRDAIAALAQTAGGDLLVAQSGRAPMLEALRYSERRVRLDAALAIAASNPTQSFAGDFAVVPTLVSAIADTGATRVAVIGGSIEDRQAIGRQLSEVGLAMVADAASFDEVEVGVLNANGVDLVVARGSVDEVSATLARVRTSGATSASPVVAIANALEESSARRAFQADSAVVVWTEGSTADSFRGAATLAMTRGSGGAIEESEAIEYAVRSAEALRGLAFGGSKIFPLADAEPALLRALSERSGGLRMLVAEVLALMALPAAQSALLDAAIGAEGEEQIFLCDYAALAARSGGAPASERQLAALRDLISASEGATADAAGRLYGSLDAGSAEAVKLITK